LLGTFSANLETLPGAAAMRRYVLWLKALAGKPVFVGSPKALKAAFPNIGSTRISIPISPSTTPSMRVRCSAICLLRISASPSANRR
jgi:hypothetical protein